MACLIKEHIKPTNYTSFLIAGQFDCSDVQPSTDHVFKKSLNMVFLALIAPFKTISRNLFCSALEKHY